MDVAAGCAGRGFTRQGNVTQELKFNPEFRQTTFELYTGLVAASHGRLVVLPESAFPVFAEEMPESVLLERAGSEGRSKLGKVTDAGKLRNQFASRDPFVSTPYNSYAVDTSAHTPEESARLVISYFNMKPA